MLAIESEKFWICAGVIVGKLTLELTGAEGVPVERLVRPLFSQALGQLQEPCFG